MKTIPANKIERVCAINVRIDQALLFDQDFKVALSRRKFLNPRAVLYHARNRAPVR